MTPIVFIGFMGAGKTTVSKKLAKTLGKPMIDMDEQLVKLLGCTIDAYFAAFGEQDFRTHETTLLKKILQKDSIIATGGGIVLSKENRVLLTDYQIIYLKANTDVLIQRIRQDKKNVRPLALKNDDSQLEKMIAAREVLYEQTAAVTIDTSQKTPEEIVAEIINWLETDE